MSRRHEALVRREPFDEAVDTPAMASADSVENSQSRSVRRQEQPVAIIRIARLWPGAERTAAAAAMPVLKTVDVDPLRDSLDAFGSEVAIVPLAPAPAVGPVAVPRPVPPPVSAPRDWSAVLTGLRW